MLYRRARVLALGLAAVSLLSACAASDSPAATPAPPPERAPTTQPLPEPPIVVSWSGPFDARLPNGWTVGDCEGTRPHVCVRDGSRLLGDIELVAGYPLDAADRALSPDRIAVAWATRMIEHFRVDRADGCPDFRFTASEVVPVTVAGRPGARGGFTLTDGAGRVVEKVVNHYLASADSVAIINTDAYARTGGCLGPAEADPSFVPEDLDSLLSHLDRLVAASPIELDQ